MAEINEDQMADKADLEAEVIVTEMEVADLEAEKTEVSKAELTNRCISKEPSR